MRVLAQESKVYSEFFTSGSVAWFSAGIIAPFFAKTLSIKEGLASLVSLLFCILFLRLAVRYNKEK